MNWYWRLAISVNISLGLALKQAKSKGPGLHMDAVSIGMASNQRQAPGVIQMCRIEYRNWLFDAPSLRHRWCTGCNRGIDCSMGGKVMLAVPRIARLPRSCSICRAARASSKLPQIRHDLCLFVAAPACCCNPASAVRRKVTSVYFMDLSCCRSGRMDKTFSSSLFHCVDLPTDMFSLG